LSGAIHLVAWGVALVLGLRHLWSRRYVVIGDGISYLDIGDAFAHGDWASAVSAYWSPLYAWLLGLALRAAAPSAYWEFAAIAAFNFLVFVCALASFRYLLTSLVRHHWDGVGRESAHPRTPLPEWCRSSRAGDSIDTRVTARCPSLPGYSCSACLPVDHAGCGEPRSRSGTCGCLLALGWGCLRSLEPRLATWDRSSH
jgi:hypothetical protein